MSYIKCPKCTHLKYGHRVGTECASKPSVVRKPVTSAFGNGPLEINGVKVNIELQDNKITGWFGDGDGPSDLLTPKDERNSIVMHLKSDEQGEYLDGSELYIPVGLRGKGLASKVVELTENWAKSKGITRIHRTPGNENGAVFWTMKGYDWVEPDDETCRELMKVWGRIADKKGWVDEGNTQESWRFAAVRANWKQIENCEELHELLERVEDVMWNDSVNKNFFSAEELLEIGSDSPFECQLTGEQTWVGKVLLHRAGGWTAVKYL